MVEVKRSSTEDEIVLDDDDEISFESQNSIFDSLNKPTKVEKLVEQRRDGKSKSKGVLQLVQLVVEVK